MTHRLTIDFDSEEVLDLFRGWLSDGGGESDFMEMAENKGLAVDLDYDEDTVTVTSVWAAK